MGGYAPLSNHQFPSLEVLLSLKDEAIGRYDSTLNRISDLKNWSNYFVVYVSAVGYLLLDNLKHLFGECYIYVSFWQIVDVLLVIAASITCLFSLYFFGASIRLKELKSLTPIQQFSVNLKTFRAEAIPQPLAEIISLQLYINSIEFKTTELQNYMQYKYRCQSHLIDCAIASTIFVLPSQIIHFLN